MIRNSPIYLTAPAHGHYVEYTRVLPSAAGLKQRIRYVHFLLLQRNSNWNRYTTSQIQRETMYKNWRVYKERIAVINALEKE